VGVTHACTHTHAHTHTHTHTHPHTHTRARAHTNLGAFVFAEVVEKKMQILSKEKKIKKENINGAPDFHGPPLRILQVMYDSCSSLGARSSDAAPPLRILCLQLPCLTLLFITAVPITKLFAWGKGGSGGHVL
jgi:hypothetical protein